MNAILWIVYMHLSNNQSYAFSIILLQLLVEILLKSVEIVIFILLKSYYRDVF